MRIIKLLSIFVIAAFGFAFAWLNGQPVALNYFWAEGTIRLSYLVILSVIAGWVLGLASMLVPYVRVRARARHAERTRAKVERENAGLRGLPVQDAK